MKGWQSGWLYITEPRDPKWAVAPEFRSGIPTRLTSWQEKGLSWGSSGELVGLQTCIQNMVSKLPNVTWPKGTFVETVKEWQQQWFYVIEPRDTTWAAAPEFQ